MFTFVFFLTSAFFLSFYQSGGFILYCWYFRAREVVRWGGGRPHLYCSLQSHAQE